MNFSEVLFFLQFIILLALLIIKIFNIFNLGKLYEFKISIMMFIISIIMFGIGLFVTLTNYSELSMSVMFKFESSLFGFYALLFIIEVFLYWKILYVDKMVRGRFNPSNEVQK